MLLTLSIRGTFSALSSTSNKALYTSGLTRGPPAITAHVRAVKTQKWMCCYVMYLKRNLCGGMKPVLILHLCLASCLDFCGAFKYRWFLLVYFPAVVLTWMLTSSGERVGRQTEAVIALRLARWQRDARWPHGTRNDITRRVRDAGAVLSVVIASPDFNLCLCKMNPSALILILVSDPLTSNTSVYHIITR